MYIEISTVALILVLQRNAVTGGSHPEQDLEEYSGLTGTREVISSAGFPRHAYNDDRIYIYRFTSESNGFVRLVSSDFKPRRQSVLKIYDGYDNNAPCSVWRLSTRPVFQSSTSHLYVVFKTGKFSNTDDEFYGWRMVVEYVPGNRDVWATEPDFPKRGLCPEFRSSKLYMGTDRSLQNLDCAWNLNFNEISLEGQTLAVVTTQYSDSNLVIAVHNGATSQHRTRSHYDSDERQGDVIKYYSVMHGDYVIVTGDMTTGSSIKMGHGVSENSALQAARRADDNQSGCKYKACARIEDSNSAACVLYWNTCGDPSYDASCETDTMLHCSVTSQCYDKDDECDGFYDCGGESTTAEDELASTCGLEEDISVTSIVSNLFGYLFWGVFGFIAMACFMNCCKRQDVGCDAFEAFGSCLCDMIGGCKSCCGTVLSGCGTLTTACVEQCSTLCKNSPPTVPPPNRQGLLQDDDVAPFDHVTGGAQTATRTTTAPHPHTTDASTTTTTPELPVRMAPSAPRQPSIVIDTEAPPPSYEAASAFPPPPVSPDHIDAELPSYEKAIQMEPQPPRYDSVKRQSSETSV